MLCTKLTNLSAASVHEALNIHANSACTFIKNSKLRLVVEQASHLVQCSKKQHQSVLQLEYNQTCSSDLLQQGTKSKPSLKGLAEVHVIRGSDIVVLREQQKRTY